MSQAASGQPTPSASGHNATRLVLRVLGLLLTFAGLALIVMAVADFFANGDDFGQGPSKFWMFFVGIPVLFVGLACLQFGFGGAVSRYLAGEHAPAMRQTGEALGLRRPDSVGTSSSGGRYCASCGAGVEADARFCRSCGTSIG